MTAPPAGERAPGDDRPPESGSLLPGGGGWLRIALAIACALTMTTLFVPDRVGGTNVLQWALMVGLTFWVVMRPGSGGPAVLLFGALVLRIVVGKPELDGRLISLVMLLPLVHQLSALAAVVPLDSAVRWRALTPTLLRYLGAVLVTVIGLLISHWLGWW